MNWLRRTGLVNKKASLGDSFRQINMPQNLIKSLYSHSCSSNKLIITELVNSEESTVDNSDNNTPSTHADIQIPLTTNDSVSSFTEHSDKALMTLEAKFSALKGYIDCEISILNCKVDLFIESWREARTKIDKHENNNMEILQENIRFL